MEADSSLVRTNRVVVLHAIAHIVLYATLVVHPRYTERENPVGYAQALNQIISFKLGMLIVGIFNGG